jgi:hypothetical protein
MARTHNTGNGSDARPEAELAYFVDTPYTPGDPMYALTEAFLADPCEYQGDLLRNEEVPRAEHWMWVM